MVDRPLIAVCTFPQLWTSWSGNETRTRGRTRGRSRITAALRRSPIHPTGRSVLQRDRRSSSRPAVLAAATVAVLLATALSAGANVADQGQRSRAPGAATPRLTSTVVPPPVGPPRTPPRPNLVVRRAEAPAPPPARPPNREAAPARPQARKPQARKADPTASAGRRLIRGPASWYGPGFAGKATASGEVYDPSELTAAHRSLPFGTRVRVTNQRNGRSVVVRINDRGPFVGGRILDVSSAAADRLRMKGHGVVPVTVQVL
ncbi:MAG: septal ring lytic transglycosylase RlpA family protein [Actinomycetota bacterium]|nr:septal ring lytic transglycosylase RlpA family protein [Actinomycetota bacterium]